MSNSIRVPYGPLELPKYRECRVGQWEISKAEGREIRGYFTGPQFCESNWILSKRDPFLSGKAHFAKPG